MVARRVDAVFISFYENVDRWYNDHLDDDSARPTWREGEYEYADDDTSAEARMYRECATIDGRRMDFHRFLSWAKYGTTRHHRRYDPYGITHLSGSYYRSFLAGHGYDVIHVNIGDRVVVENLAERYAPRFVLISTTFLVETAAISDAILRCRRAWPEARIVCGGLCLVELERSLPTEQYQRLLWSLNADAYVSSALGEEPLVTMMAANGGDLAELDLPSTWVRRTTGMARGSARDERGLPIDEHYVRWGRLASDTLYHTVHTRTARSCAFTCAFCSYFVNQGPLVLEEPATVERELEELRAHHPHVRSVVFTDDTLNVPAERFKELCRVLTKFDYDWYSFCRVQFCDAETADLMADSGCRGVFLGIESLRDDVLRNMHKAATKQGYERGMEQLKRVGIPCHANFIIGFPGDVPESADDVVEFVDRFEVETYTASPFYMSPATPIEKERAKYKIEGAFYHWKHATMDSAQAHRVVQELKFRPKHAVFSTEEGGNSFWSEIMLYCNGYDADEVRALCRAFLNRMGRSVAADEYRASDEYRELKRLLDKVDMPDPPVSGYESEPVAAAV